MESGPNISVAGGDKFMITGMGIAGTRIDITIYQVVTGSADISVQSIPDALPASGSGSVVSKSLPPGTYRIKTYANGSLYDTQTMALP